MNISAEKPTAPVRVIAAVWCSAFALILVFARDVSQWAVRLENPAVQAVFLPVAQAAESAATATGISAARKSVEGTIWPFYDSSPLIAGGSAFGAPEDAPPLTETQIKDIADAAKAAAAVAAAPKSAASTSIALPNLAPQLAATLGSVQSGEQIDASTTAPKRILIVGASSIQEGLGTELEAQLKQFKGVEVKRFGQYSTGLCRPDYFDWPKKLRELMDSFKPDMVIGQWGENDCQGMGNQDGSFHSKFGTPEWDTEYGKRVTALVKMMEDGGAQAVLVGIPIMRAKKLSQQVDRLNSVSQKATEAAGGTYVSSWHITADSDGKYRGAVQINGKEKMIRAGDGVHLSNYGAEYVAGEIIKAIGKQFTLTAK
jgi:uncharacterized protein